MKRSSGVLLSLLFTFFMPTKAQDRPIYGSRQARLGEFPYQLSLQSSDKHFCGASLSSVSGRQIVITAAHCMHAHSGIKIVAGELQLDRVSLREQTRYVSKVITHPNYNRTTLENDIALIFLDTPFDLNFNVQVIPLPTPFQSTFDTIVVTGWNNRDTITRDMPNVTHLQTVTLPVLNDSICRSRLGVTYNSVLCIGYVSEYQAACSGDGGGPGKSQSGHLVGIASYANAFGCRLPGEPDVFTEVSHFVDWIRQETYSPETTTIESTTAASDY